MQNDKTAASASEPQVVSASVAAANAFINILNDEQRSAALYAIDDPAKPNWSNLPVGVLDFERNGVRKGDLDSTQNDALFRFLSTALSPAGYSKVVAVVGADSVLSNSPRAAYFQWTDDNYWLAFFGKPSDYKPWGWQFGGHHLALNVTVVNGRSYMSPTFIGVEPASYEMNGSIVAPLKDEFHAGIKLINSLDEQEQAQAIVADRPVEVWAGAGQDGIIPAIEGLSVACWNEERRQLLLNAIALWVRLLDESSSNARFAEIQSELDDLHFAWHGDIDGAGPIYYRIQGPTLIIEFSTQGSVGGGGHYHSMYRNPTNEYGSGAVK